MIKIKKNFLHLRNNVQRNIPNDHLFIKLKEKINKNKLTYTSDFIDDLFNNNCSSGVDARNQSRANSGVKLCVAISVYIKNSTKIRN